MKHRRLRVAVVTCVLAALAGVTWFYFAPISIGGGTAYIITHGVSMEPLFHTGDLAIVRAASAYKVGEIVAYHSFVLREVVLHRIVAIHGGRYTFKGDNNHFLDPVHPTRSELIGRLWIHIPHAGLVLARVRTPVGAAILAVAMGLVLLSFERDHVNGRRSRLRGATVSGEARAVKPADSDGSRAVSLRDGVIASGVAVVVFLALGLFAFHRPYRVAGTRAVPYTQHAAFTYSADVQPDAVYPTGRLVTGDPIFLNFVNSLDVGLHYRLTTPGAAHVSGTTAVALQVTGPTGWRRTIPLTGRRSFTAGRFSSTVVIDLTSVKNLLSQVQSLTGVSGSDSTVAVVASVRVAGLVSGGLLRTTFSPVLSFQMGTTQLLPQGSSGSVTGSAHVFTYSRTATVTVASSRANPVSVLGHSLSVKLLRFLAGAGFLLSVLVALTLGIMLRRLRRLAEPEQIEAEYGHLIVPLADDAAFSGQIPLDLVSMDALVKLAEHCGRLILHSQHEDGDTYLVSDGDALYRYRVGMAAGEITEPPFASLPLGPGDLGDLQHPEDLENPDVRDVAPVDEASPSPPLVVPSVDESSPTPPPLVVPSVDEAAAAFTAAVLAAASAVPSRRAPGPSGAVLKRESVKAAATRAHAENDPTADSTEPIRVWRTPTAPQTPPRSRPASLGSPPAQLHVSRPEPLSGEPAVPRAGGSSDNRGALHDPHVADADSLTAVATRALIAAARRLRRHLT